MRRSADDFAALAGRFHALSRVLGERARGGDAAGRYGPGWLDPSMIESLVLDLAPGAATAGPPILRVALRDGVPGHALPHRWQAAPGVRPLTLLPVRAPRAMAQLGLQVRRDALPLAVGTATALVRDRQAPDRNYVLTSGHVMAPGPDAAVSDIALIGGATIGYLAEWQPALGGEAFPTRVDGALVEVVAEDAVALRAVLADLPRGVGSRIFLDQPVRVRRVQDALAGLLKTHWSGYVDLPDVSPGYPDYFLASAVGYASAEPTLGGDSGAAVWNTDDTLAGMHIGALPDAQPGHANAVMSPIEPVLDWFNVQPYTRNDPARLPAPAAQPTPGTVAGVGPAAGDDDEQVTIVACTLWGEARGEGRAGMKAVAAVIVNRVRVRGGAFTFAQVCQARKQFSCWNEDDPNRRRLDRLPREPDEIYRRACDIAREAIAGRLVDPTRGATHYVAATLRRRPPWLAGKQPCVVIGGHEFYNDID